MESVLLVLEQEVALFDRTERPDFEIIAGVIDFFQCYPAQCHRPKEDLLFARIKARSPESAAAVADIEAEQGQAARHLETFARLIESIVNEREIERTAIDAAARAFAAHQRRHMEIEERVLLPAALASLQAEDWAELDARLADTGKPVCDRASEARLEQLKQRIARWEREDQADRAWLSQGR